MLHYRLSTNAVKLFLGMFMNSHLLLKFIFKHYVAPILWTLAISTFPVIKLHLTVQQNSSMVAAFKPLYLLCDSSLSGVVRYMLKSKNVVRSTIFLYVMLYVETFVMRDIVQIITFACITQFIPP